VNGGRVLAGVRRGAGRRNFLVRALFDDFGLKLLALLTSLFIFYLVRGAEDAQRSFFVEVLVLLPDDSDRVLMSDVPERLRVTVQGTRSILNNVDREELGPVQMDFRTESPSYFYFEPSNLDLPAGVRVVQLAPASVPLRWEPRVEKNVRVEANLRGTPRDGLALVRPVEVTPARVTLSGPRSLVDGIDVLETGEIPVSGLPEGVHRRRTSLPLNDPRLEIVGDPTVGVALRVEAERARRTFPPAPVAVPTAPVRTRVRPARVTVTVLGPPQRVAAVDASALIPTVDVSGIDPGSRDVPVAVTVRGVPDGVETTVDPPEVLVTLPKS